MTTAPAPTISASGSTTSSARPTASSAKGWTLIGAQRDPGDGEGFGVFTYVQPPTGLIVELVDRAVLPFFEQWWQAALV